MLDALREKDEDVEEQIEEWVEKVGEKIDRAVENGDLTDEEGWEKWETFKEKELEPKLDHCLENDLVSEEWVEELELGIEMAEAGALLEDAVAKGEMTEKQAWDEWHKRYGNVLDEEEDDDDDEDEDDEDEDDDEEEDDDDEDE